MDNVLNPETIWHVSFNYIDKEQYVLACNEKQVNTILKRMFQSPNYDFDWRIKWIGE